LKDRVPAEAALAPRGGDDDAARLTDQHLDPLAVAEGHRGAGQRAALGIGRDQGANPRRADGQQEPANERSRQAAQGVDEESGVLDDDRPPGHEEGSLCLGTNDHRHVERLNLRQVEGELLDRRAENRFHLAHLAGVARNEEEAFTPADARPVTHPAARRGRW
jgi:hypothetical protein